MSGLSSSEIATRLKPLVEGLADLSARLSEIGERLCGSAELAPFVEQRYQTRFQMKPRVGSDWRPLGGRKNVQVRPSDIIRCEKCEIRTVIDKYIQLDPDPRPISEYPVAVTKISARAFAVAYRDGGELDGMGEYATMTAEAFRVLSDMLLLWPADTFRPHGVAEMEVWRSYLADVQAGPLPFSLQKLPAEYRPSMKKDVSDVIAFDPPPHEVTGRCVELGRSLLRLYGGDQLGPSTGGAVSASGAEGQGGPSAEPQGKGGAIGSEARDPQRYFHRPASNPPMIEPTKRHIVSRLRSLREELGGLIVNLADTLDLTHEEQAATRSQVATAAHLIKAVAELWQDDDPWRPAREIEELNELGRHIQRLTLSPPTSVTEFLRADPNPPKYVSPIASVPDAVRQAERITAKLLEFYERDRVTTAGQESPQVADEKAAPAGIEGATPNSSERDEPRCAVEVRIRFGDILIDGKNRNTRSNDPKYPEWAVRAIAFAVEQHKRGRAFFDKKEFIDVVNRYRRTNYGSGKNIRDIFRSYPELFDLFESSRKAGKGEILKLRLLCDPLRSKVSP